MPLHRQPDLFETQADMFGEDAETPTFRPDLDSCARNCNASSPRHGKRSRSHPQNSPSTAPSCRKCPSGFPRTKPRNSASSSTPRWSVSRRRSHLVKSWMAGTSPAMTRLVIWRNLSPPRKPRLCCAHLVHLRGAIMRRREAGRGAVPAGSSHVSEHSGGAGAPPRDQ